MNSCPRRTGKCTRATLDHMSPGRNTKLLPILRRSITAPLVMALHGRRGKAACRLALPCSGENVASDPVSYLGFYLLDDYLT